MQSIWLPLAASDVGSVPAAAHAAWQKVPPCWCIQVLPHKPMRQWVFSAPYPFFRICTFQLEQRLRILAMERSHCDKSVTMRTSEIYVES